MNPEIRRVVELVAAADQSDLPPEEIDLLLKDLRAGMESLVPLLEAHLKEWDGFPMAPFGIRNTINLARTVLEAGPRPEERRSNLAALTWLAQQLVRHLETKPKPDAA